MAEAEVAKKPFMISASSQHVLEVAPPQEHQGHVRSFRLQVTFFGICWLVSCHLRQVAHGMLWLQQVHRVQFETDMGVGMGPCSDPKGGPTGNGP